VRTSCISNTVVVSVFICSSAIIAAMGTTANNAKNAHLSRRSAKHETENPSVQRRLLRSQDPHVVANACSALADLRVKQAAPDIIAVVNESTNTDVQSKCAFALSRIGSADAGPFLRALATDSRRDIAVRVAAIRGSSLIEGIDTSYLVALLDDSNTNVRAMAAYVLCQLQVEEAVPTIRKMLVATDENARQLALTAASVWPNAFTTELGQVAVQASNRPEDRIVAGGCPLIRRK